MSNQKWFHVKSEWSEKFLNFYRRDITTNCGPNDEIPPNRVNTTQNLADLRDLLVQYEIDAYYVPLDEVGRRKWISGFSGSNGDVIVTLEKVRFVYILSAVCLQVWN